MNMDYVSGFFDADGSITLSKWHSTDKYRSAIKIDFTNTDLALLLEIKEYFRSLGLRSYISTKPPRKDNHRISYSLACGGSYAIRLAKLLSSKHLVKKHRLAVLNKYYLAVTPRNGKYSEAMGKRRLAFERLFFWSLVS